MGDGSHLSFHTLMLLPFPTLQMSPWLNRFFAARMHFQANEDLHFAFASSTDPSLKYFSLRIVVTSVSGLDSTRHSCFTSNTKLKDSRSQNPIPHSNFETFRQFQFIQCILPFSTLVLHQKFAKLAVRGARGHRVWQTWWWFTMVR